MKPFHSFVAPLVACAFALSACSSPDGDVDPIDVDGGGVVDGGDGGTPAPDGGAPDSGPSCTETLPTGVVFGNLTLETERTREVLSPAATPGGRFMVPFSGVGFGVYSGRIWNGAAWVVSSISPAGATSSIGYPVSGAVGEKFVAAFSQAYPGDSPVPTRVYTETSPGVFGAGETAPTSSANLSQSVAYLATSNRTGLAATNGTGTIQFAERSDGAPAWNVGTVLPATVGTSAFPVIAGYKPNGTAFMVIYRRTGATGSFVLFRRAGVAWSEIKTLSTHTSTNVYNTAAKQTAGGKLYIGWEEFALPSSASVKAITLDLETETASAVSTILPPTPVTVQNTIYVNFGASADGKTVVYAIHDRTTRQLGLGFSDDGLTFSALKPYHPELGHDGAAIPLFSRCGKPLLMHRSFEIGGSASARYTIDELSKTEDLGIL